MFKRLGVLGFENYEVLVCHVGEVLTKSYMGGIFWMSCWSSCVRASEAGARGRRTSLLQKPRSSMTALMPAGLLSL